MRVERDPAFWTAIANHPAVRPLIVISGELPDMTAMITDPKVLPLAFKHGGFLLFQRDGLGRVFELHTLFTPEGWGAEAAAAAHETCAWAFLHGCDIAFTVEIATNRRSRPPLSFGWRAAGPFRPSPELAADVRTWVLTQAAWDASPARRRISCQLSSPSPLLQ